MSSPRWSLTELLAPLPVAEFRRDYWGRRAFATRIPDGALAWLRSELAGFDVARLVRGNRGPIAVWFPGLEGRQHSVGAGAEEALALYDAGMTIFMSNGGTAPIMKWQGAIADDVGHPALPLTTALFLSRRSAGTGPHFDMLENITIQLSGHKRWRVAANPSVRQPLENWQIGQPVPPSLERTLDRPLPGSMPDGGEDFDLVPGSLLYIPRGHFHAAEAALDSVSLFLGMPVMSWADLLLEGMRAQLERLPHWRENVHGGSAPEELANARRRLDELRAGLAGDLGGLDSAFLLPDFRGALDGARALRRNPLASLQVGLGAALHISVSLPLGKLARGESFTLPKEHAPLFAWLAAHGTFTVDEVNAAHPEIPRQAMLELLAVLQRAGLFT